MRAFNNPCRGLECEPNADLFCNADEHTCTGCGVLMDCKDPSDTHCHQCEIDATARLFDEMNEVLNEVA